MYSAERCRRLVGLVALLIVALGVVPAPVLHGWLHGDEVPAHERPHTACMACRLASLPMLPAADAPIVAAAPVPTPVTRPFARHPAPPPPGTPLRPPCRAPPAV